VSFTMPLFTQLLVKVVFSEVCSRKPRSTPSSEYVNDATCFCGAGEPHPPVLSEVLAPTIRGPRRGVC
jgi:hypothetical protein